MNVFLTKLKNIYLKITDAFIKSVILRSLTVELLASHLHMLDIKMLQLNNKPVDVNLDKKYSELDASLRVPYRDKAQLLLDILIKK